jgi:hypothetical protein
MSDDAQQFPLIVGGYQIGAAVEDPAHVVVRLSATRDGPHYHFLFDAPMLDQLAGALTDAATKIRKRAS